MGHGHFRQAAHQQQGDQRADGVAEQDAGACETDGEGAAHEQAGADGAADGDHAHLRGREPPLQALFAARDGLEALGVVHLDVLWNLIGVLMNCRGNVGGDVRVPVAGSCARERWVLAGRPGNTGAVRAGGTQVTLCRTW